MSDFQVCLDDVGSQLTTDGQTALEPEIALLKQPIGSWHEPKDGVRPLVAPLPRSSTIEHQDAADEVLTKLR